MNSSISLSYIDLPHLDLCVDSDPVSQSWFAAFFLQNAYHVLSRLAESPCPTWNPWPGQWASCRNFPVVDLKSPKVGLPGLKETQSVKWQNHIITRDHPVIAPILSCVCDLRSIIIEELLKRPFWVWWCNQLNMKRFLASRTVLSAWESQTRTWFDFDDSDHKFILWLLILFLSRGSTTMRCRGRWFWFWSQISNASNNSNTNGVHFTKLSRQKPRDALNCLGDNFNHTAGVVFWCLIETPQLQSVAKGPAAMQLHSWFLQFRPGPIEKQFHNQVDKQLQTWGLDVELAVLRPRSLGTWNLACSIPSNQRSRMSPSLEFATSQRVHRIDRSLYWSLRCRLYWVTAPSFSLRGTCLSCSWLFNCSQISQTVNLSPAKTVALPEKMLNCWTLKQVTPFCAGIPTRPSSLTGRRGQRCWTWAKLCIYKIYIYIPNISITEK